MVSEGCVSVNSTEITSNSCESIEHPSPQYMGLQKRRLIDQFESLNLSTAKPKPLIQVLKSEDYCDSEMSPDEENV